MNLVKSKGNKVKRGITQAFKRRIKTFEPKHGSAFQAKKIGELGNRKSQIISLNDLEKDEN